MSKRTEHEFLLDIKEATKRILKYSENLDYEIFTRDLKTQDAIVRNIEIIGEAVKNLSVEFIDQYPHIPWKNIAGMRDKLIHHYFGVNIDIVWDITRFEIPKLKKQIEEILAR
ncbi:DUF86 domain-containing protein [candidate division KSB1 bacterium]|nr:DUF86 domain-containing protein [candidate division KSB1 bacterium]